MKDADPAQTELDACMSGQDGGADGGDNSGAGAEYDLALAEKIMRTIERYIQDEEINPDPLSLRNTMLAVAALLHLQSVEINGDALQETFAEAASGQMEAVMQVAVALQRKN